MLPIDDPAWDSMDVGSVRASDVQHAIRRLKAAPDWNSPDTTALGDLVALLGPPHREVSEVTYAAVPHVVDLAKRRPPTEKALVCLHMLFLIGASKDPAPEVHGFADALRCMANVAAGIVGSDELSASTRAVVVAAMLIDPGCLWVARLALMFAVEEYATVYCPHCDALAWVEEEDEVWWLRGESGRKCRITRSGMPRPALTLIANASRKAGVDTSSARCEGVEGHALCPECHKDIGVADALETSARSGV